MSSVSSTVYLDLDRTLFATAGASLAIWNELAQHYPVDGVVESERQHQFYIFAQSDSYYYDFVAHLHACQIDPDEAAERLMASSLADNRLLMPGAEGLVKRLELAGFRVEVLTFGQEYYQRLKVALCPALSHLAVHVTLQPKALFLADKGECIMIDDKNIAHELPSNVHFFWVQLEGGVSPTHDGAYTSLTGVADDVLNTNIDIK